ncbi:uncharacterized protein J3R85_015114 [Psidium guajava]|nr:uncharacterized protein J3R85_015114 [Psidium guajava]
MEQNNNLSPMSVLSPTSAVVGESRRELLSPHPDDPPYSMDDFRPRGDDDDDSAPSWRLSLNEFHLPPRDHRDPSRFSCRRLLPAPRKERKIAEYYQKQESLLEGYNEMQAMTESGCFPGGLTEV